MTYQPNDTDANAADVAEQGTPVYDDPGDEAMNDPAGVDTPGEADPADAFDQRRPVPLDDDAYENPN